MARAQSTCWRFVVFVRIAGSRSSVQRITELEMREPPIRDNIKAFDEVLDKYLGKRKFPASDGDKPDPKDWANLIRADEDFKEEFFKVYQDENLPDVEAVSKQNFFKLSFEF